MTTETPTIGLMRWHPIDPAVHACWKLITDAIEWGMLVDGDVDEVRHHVAAGRDIVLDELALERIGDALRVRFHDREATCAPDDLLAELTKALEGVGSISGFDGAMDQLGGAMFAISTALDAAQNGAMPLEPLASALRAGREQLEGGRTLLALGADERGVDAFVNAELGQLDRIADVLRDGSATPARLRRLGEDFLEHEPAGRSRWRQGSTVPARPDSSSQRWRRRRTMPGWSRGREKQPRCSRSHCAAWTPTITVPLVRASPPTSTGTRRCSRAIVVLRTRSLVREVHDQVHCLAGCQHFKQRAKK